MSYAPRQAGSTRARGRRVESEAAEWLEARGFTVIDRNFQVRGGEVDLVVRREGIIAFVEVRSRTRADWGRPEETVGRVKQARVRAAARAWLARHGNAGCDLRFDVLAVLGPPGAREFTWYPDAFRGES